MIFFGKNNFKCTWMISKGGRQMALEIFRRKEQKLIYRQKLRLRIYDDTDENWTAFFEIKQKHKKVVNKRRMLLPLKEAKRYLSQNLHHPLLNYETSNEQVMREIHYFRQLYAL